ncbi:MAG: GNAT family N-acetyltransferase [Glaciecola sp.]|jgi:predicted GNAT superfamily acetyltransferase
MTEAVTIRTMTPSDHAQVLALNDYSVVVLSPLDDAALAQLITQSSVHVVVEVAGKVVGFLLAVGPKSPYASINYQWFDQHYSAFLYVDRIVVHHDYRAQRLGHQLYEYLTQWALEQGFPQLCAEIDIQPPNLASLQFHEKWGFVAVSELAHNPNKVVSLQVKSLT